MSERFIPARRPDLYASIDGGELLVRTPKISRAYQMGEEAHSGQKRKSGEPYFYHCVAVSNILSTWGLTDENLHCAALLHDVLEDSDITIEEIEANFGREVATLVDGVSKFRTIDGKDDDRETRRKVLTSSYINPKVPILKLPDRLHNMRTLASMLPHKQEEKAKETLEVYTHLAESLGMWVVKTELEDQSFPYMDPKNYHKVVAQIDSDPRLTDYFLDHYTSHIENLLAEQGYSGRVTLKLGGYYELFKKREIQAAAGKSSIDNFSAIEDVVSIRVCLENLRHCYGFIGIIHQEFGDIVDFDAYDEYMGANKQDNGYQALQTTLQLPQGALEIAVTTPGMEEFNNWGVVSLMRKGQKNLDDYLLKAVILTNGGREKFWFMPKAATGVDLAYSIDSKLGSQAEGLLIDGKKVGLTTQIPNAARVSVIPGIPRRAPDPALLNYALPATKRKIREQLTAKGRDETVEKGKEIVKDQLAHRGIFYFEDLPDGLVQNLLYELDCGNVDDIYFYVGMGATIHERIETWLDENNCTKEGLGLTSILVDGSDQPGVLHDITSWIVSQKGNIENIVLRTEKQGYKMHLVIKGLEGEGEEYIKEKFARDARFRDWKVV